MITRLRARLSTRVAISASALALFFVLLTGGGAWLVTAQLIRGQVADLLETHRTVGFSTYGEQFRGIHVNQTFTGIAIGCVQDTTP